MICKEDQNIYKPYLEIVDYAVERLVENNNTKPILLDAGCGHSTVLEDIYKKCKTVLGVDLDREGLNANKLVDKKIYACLTDIPIEDNSVDIVTSAWVLEHIEDPEAFMHEIDRVLKPGGFFVFIAPNIDGWFAFASSIIPDKFHGFINKHLYRRSTEDTFKSYYKMNSEEDLDKLLVDEHNYRKLRFIYNDDPKYIGFNIFLRPFASLWHRIVMKNRCEKLRVHIVGLYFKP